MPKITFIYKDGTEKVVDAHLGLSVMEVALKNNIEAIEGSCGGSLACATCHLYVHPDWWDKVLPYGEDAISDDEEDMLDLGFDKLALADHPADGRDAMPRIQHARRHLE